LQQSLFDTVTDPSHSGLEAELSRRRPRIPAESPLRLVVLGSGSGGNSVVVEASGRRLLIDAGFSCREIERRLALAGLAPQGFDALVVTHEHEDHVRGADRFCRRHGVPLFATAGTLDGSPLSEAVHRGATVIRSGEPWEVGGFRLEAFGIPHDAREPVGLVVEDDFGRRVGLVADLGTRSRLAWGRLAELDLLILETNHDLEMLRNGPYPWPLKQRVAGRHGHLSNEDAAQGLAELVCDRLRWVVLYHLSRTNNLPALAAAAVGEALGKEGSPAALVVAQQHEPTEWVEIP
jgi:phosphoribosyl 1,2-cyclic phosphodiesterase